ncbi:MAG: hypothetical protein IKF78_03795 [Atopobiaceae bacterium]|nr:hypothetical protein [Atopobiaceae bacterium]
MADNFKSAVFSLCKKLASHPKSREIRALVHDVSVMVEAEGELGRFTKPSHGDLVQVAEFEGHQFLGFLLADTHAERYNSVPQIHVSGFDIDERQLMETAHATLALFVDCCIGDLREKYPKASALLDPYAQYENSLGRIRVNPFLNRGDFAECAATFKGGRLYQELMSSDVLQIVESAAPDTIFGLSGMLNKQFMENLDYTSDETHKYLRRIAVATKFSAEDFLMASCCYCHALRLSLELALQMFFDAILGSNIAVMDDSNVIKIEDHASDMVYEKYIVLVQGVASGLGGSAVGGIALLTCSPPERPHVKEFGVMVALIETFESEFGETAKITMVTVNEELNRLHRMTDRIMNSPLGRTSVILHPKRECD